MAARIFLGRKRITLNYGFSTLPSLMLQERIQSGLVAYDPYQSKIVHHFDKIYLNFSKYQASKLFHRLPKSLYVYGGVGRGKTMLMDILFECCQPNLKYKTHFNEFMAEVHSLMHAARITPDPIQTVAAALSSRACLFCFDEFQVTDIADAMILKRLFEKLWKKCIFVMTSNSAPDDLYKNGLNREHFLPFVALLKMKADIVNLDSKIDYREQKSSSEYFFLIRQETDDILDKLFMKLGETERMPIESKTITVSSRSFLLKKTCGQILDSSFIELCDQDIGASDYIKLTEIFHTVFIRKVPKLSSKFVNQAQRFVKLIDILYLKRTRVVISAEEEIINIFDTKHPSLKLTGEERTISRLNEMKTEQYWKNCAK